jgi:hypothetical protein
MKFFSLLSVVDPCSFLRFHHATSDFGVKHSFARSLAGSAGAHYMPLHP